MELFQMAPSPYNNYRVESLGFESKEEAYEEIRKYYYNLECTTYYDKNDHLWYIIVLV